MCVRKERLIAIDLLRIISVFVIFLFHSNMLFACQYGFFTPFISMGAIFMTAFFILSGFSLYYVNSYKAEFQTLQDIVTFYKKRVVGIMPIYWFMVVVYPFWDIVVNHNSILHNLILLPVEILGIQSVFHSLSVYTHNGGTWFVSCLIICYFIFPLLFKLVQKKYIREKVICGVLAGAVLLYSPLLVVYFGIEGIYSNIFFRALEFLIGILLCSLWLDLKDKRLYRKLSNWYIFIILLILLILSVTILAKDSFFIGNYMLYSWISLPCFCLLFFFSAGIKTIVLQKSIVVKYMVDVSYAFFFAQFFTWKISNKLLELIGKDNNFLRIIISFLVCSFISIVLHEAIEKPLRQLLKKSFKL